MLKLDSVSKKYPGEQLGAVINASFELTKGEILSIVGKSGSGKTTLLRMIAGLIKPDKGKVLFDGVELDDPTEQLIAGHRDIKLVFQDFQLKQNMTVAENVNYQLLHYDRIFQEERTRELLHLCKLELFSHKMPHELSGGQQQRLALARALSEDPKLLLMDEPFSSLDPITKRALIKDLIEIVAHEEISLILVTHDIQDTLQLSDQIVFISEGQVLQIGQPSQLYKYPNNLEVAMFFGSLNQVKDNCYLRSEDLYLSEADTSEITATITHSNFNGQRYYNYGWQENMERSFYSSHQLIQGQKYCLSYTASDLICFD
jgi:iron(III) transport system ATP-binding protein